MQESPQQNFREFLRCMGVSLPDVQARTSLTISTLRRIRDEGRAAPWEREAVCACLKITPETLDALLRETMTRPGKDARGRKPKETAGAV